MFINIVKIKVLITIGRSIDTQMEENKVKKIDMKYKITTECIGKGSFAKVMKAESLQNPAHIVACKIIQKKMLQQKIEQQSKVNDKEELKKYIIGRIREQLKVWKTLKHPNIVQFQYFSETNNNIYLFMKYCQGKNLCELIRQRGALEERQVVKLISELVSAVCYIHQRKIIHRDIKAQNVLLHQGRAILADFGFAKFVRNIESFATGTQVGTVFYMAPQVLDENPKYSAKCDVWSIGILIYVLLHGFFPWPSDINQIDLKIKRKTIQISPNLKISEQLKNAIKMTLKCEQKERIDIKELQAILQGIKEKMGIMDVE